MSSSPADPRGYKRRREATRSSPAPATPNANGRSSLPPSSLPPSSPPAFTDDSDAEALGYESDEPVQQADQIDDEEDDEGEDLMADGLMDQDYNENVLLDTYDAADIDDEGEFAEMSLGERRAAEAAMSRRDRQERGLSRRARRAPGFLPSDDEDEEDAGMLEGMVRRTRRQYDERRNVDDAAGQDDAIPLEDLGDIKADSIAEWISTEPVGKAIVQHFRAFLTGHTDGGMESVYGAKITRLAEQNLESLEVSFKDLADYKPILAYFLANCPAPMLAYFDEVAMQSVLSFYPAYERIHAELHVRITDLPTSCSLRDLRQANLNCLVRVSGVVTRRSGVFPQLKYVKFDCKKCGETLGPFYQDASKEIRISFCPNCESRGPFTVNTEQTVYRNYQKMTLQESPGSVPAGRLPRHREVILLWDLIDSAKPGEEIEVTGIYRNNFDASLNAKNGFPVFSTVIEANHINKKEDLFAAFRLTEEDERKIIQLSRDPRIRKRIIKSIAPSIFGHDDIKTAIALSLFGGVPKDVKGKHRVRGDINVLLLGDPGTAKSQFLKYVEKTAHRSVFTTGQGASAVGLTASVRKDPATQEWTLEGGALVLADKGVCMIDEFDKMNDSDRTSIHEAMEQQSISISKAGIVTTLQARCAIIAAANPIRGRYNPTIPFQQNVELTEPIISRFDVLCVVKDTVDPVKDELLAKFVVDSHTRSHPSFKDEEDEIMDGEDAEAARERSKKKKFQEQMREMDADIIPQDILRKYIMYAKDRVRPKLQDMDQEKLARLYAELRRESQATGSMPITVRHLESSLRMAEASAKMQLREYVRADDIDLAIQVSVGSFVNCQKMSVKKTLDRMFRKYVHRARDHEELVHFLLGNLIKEKVRIHQAAHHNPPPSVSVKLSELEDAAREHEIYDVQPYLHSAVFRANGYELSKLRDKQGAEVPAIEKRFVDSEEGQPTPPRQQRRSPSEDYVFVESEVGGEDEEL